MINGVARKTIEGWIDKASNHLSIAKNHAESPYRSSEAVQAAQECVELSVKSVLSLLGIRYPRAHEWPANGKAFADIAHQIRERELLTRLEEQHLSHTIRLPRLLFLLNFWAQFYLTAKYGFEVEHLAAARELFDTADARLATEHAEESLRAAQTVLHLDEKRRLAIVAPSGQREG
jgi:HEPN domain-containing protein